MVRTYQETLTTSLLIGRKPPRVQHVHCARGWLALALFCSRGSPTSVSSPPEFHSSAAMSVQYNAVASNPTLYIVLYCLTPPQFHRYSSLTLCPPFPAWGDKETQIGSSRECGRHPKRKRNLPGKQCSVSTARRKQSQNPHPVANGATRMGHPKIGSIGLRSLRCSN